MSASSAISQPKFERNNSESTNVQWQDLAASSQPQHHVKSPSSLPPYQEKGFRPTLKRSDNIELGTDSVSGVQRVHQHADESSNNARDLLTPPLEFRGDEAKSLIPRIAQTTEVTVCRVKHREGMKIVTHTRLSPQFKLKRVVKTNSKDSSTIGKNIKRKRFAKQRVFSNSKDSGCESNPRRNRYAKNESGYQSQDMESLSACDFLTNYYEQDSSYSSSESSDPYHHQGCKILEKYSV